MKSATPEWKFLLSQLASYERDPEKLVAITAEIKRLSDEKERRFKPASSNRKPAKDATEGIASGKVA